jgi:glucose/mannose-6-phosphate isomerase
MDIVHRIIAGNGISVIEVESVGESALSRMFSLIQLADFVSYYLAVLNEVDPTPVEAIETLKKELVG